MFPAAQSWERLADLELHARLVEKPIPRFRDEHHRQFDPEVVQSYRAVARDILRNAWSDDRGHESAEYAVMLAVIPVLVVGTI